MFTDNDFTRNPETPEGKLGFSDQNADFLFKSEDGFRSKSSRFGNLGSQELTLSYLCDTSNIEEKSLFSALERERLYKGKEVVSDSPDEEQRWVERDFLQLNGVSEGASKREGDEREETEKRDKKPKLETLNLSLSLPDVSLSLNSPNPFPKSQPDQVLQVGLKPSRSTQSLVPSNTNINTRIDHAVLKPSRSTQSLVPSNNNTRTGSSDDFNGAASMSYSYSHQFSHNPSCSLTRNSTDFYEYSVGSHRRETDPIWNCGEGTNGSVHSRFKPVGDGVSLVGIANGNGNGNPLIQGNWGINKESSLYKAAGSENQSFFPSELPARPTAKDVQSGDSRGRGSDRQRGFDNSDGGRVRRLTQPERLVREVVSESVTVMAQIFEEIPEEIIVSTKQYLKNLIVAPEKTEEFSSLQKRLERRTDLTFESLSKSNKAQMGILVTVKTGLASLLPEKNSLPTNELVEIFLQLRCRNVMCKSLLPVDDCDCKICSTKKGFCSACMCPVCLNFDCANNTCSWVGCDVCSHWCHAVCGIEKNLIKPGPSLRGPEGTTEMQFHCLGCDHASEMFGFVKDVFMCCAKDWDLETLIKELDCVKKIFKGSDDPKGRDLQSKAAEMLAKLENRIIHPSDASSAILQFFKYGKSEFSGSGSSSKDMVPTQMNQNGNVVSVQPPTSLPLNSVPYNMMLPSVQKDVPSQRELAYKNDRNAVMVDRTVEEELQRNILSQRGFDSLESIIRIKEAEARMFQSKADDARREAEQYRRMARVSNEKLEEEYTGKLAKLCLKETEDKRRKKLEELKVLENSHCDYYNMKNRMQAEIAGLLDRMEATKQQWV